jgi:hypothetical protein
VPRFAEQFQLPTRLIDVRVGAEDCTVRLVLSEMLNPAHDCRYIALSHCWGADPDKIPKTIRATLVQHQERIDKLTKTFEDAIEVTRQIGVRYLWIDSLCIIQDEATDFERECSKMGLTYARAYCVLSALGAEDGDGGLFIPRGFPASSISISQVEAMLEGPLSTRGWAFQEHQLSTRIIHFSKSRLIWECRGCIASEEFPIQTYRRLLRTGIRRNRIEDWVDTCRLFDNRIDESRHTFGSNAEEALQNISEKSIIRSPMVNMLIGQANAWGRGNKSKLHVYLNWLRAVERYSVRHLTFEPDKLPAVSGLAAAVALTIKEDYLAGIWKGDMVRGLLWLPISAATINSSNRIPSIPTWSWASYRGGIQFISLGTKQSGPIDARYNIHEDIDQARSTMMIQGLYRTDRNLIIEGSTASSSLDPFGRVTSGTLKVTTDMASCCIGRLSVGGRWRILDSDSFLGKKRFHISVDFWTDSMVGERLSVVLALLLHGSLNRGPCGFGLILKMSTPGTFHRLGVFFVVEEGREVVGGFVLNGVTIE